MTCMICRDAARSLAHALVIDGSYMVCTHEKDRLDRQTDRQKDRQTDRQSTDRQTDRQTRQTDRRDETHMQTDQTD